MSGTHEFVLEPHGMLQMIPPVRLCWARVIPIDHNCCALDVFVGGAHNHNRGATKRRTKRAHPQHATKTAPVVMERQSQAETSERRPIPTTSGIFNALSPQTTRSRTSKQRMGSPQTPAVMGARDARCHGRGSICVLLPIIVILNKEPALSRPGAEKDQKEVTSAQRKGKSRASPAKVSRRSLRLRSLQSCGDFCALPMEVRKTVWLHACAFCVMISTGQPTQT